MLRVGLGDRFFVVDSRKNLRSTPRSRYISLVKCLFSSISSCVEGYVSPLILARFDTLGISYEVFILASLRLSPAGHEVHIEHSISRSQLTYIYLYVEKFIVCPFICYLQWEFSVCFWWNNGYGCGYMVAT